MGVPAFFRWLTKKYPSIIVNCIEDNPSTDAQGVYHPLDTSQPNPNGIEFDNLYLDMNGIIHPCTHPEDRPPPKDEDEMMMLIFECIDRMFSIVRPRKLLYMAIDGVAPRAKMNQQRSRRFRASKETADKTEQMEKIKAEIRANGGLLPEDQTTKEKPERFDSNCITPGTPFMAKLAECLRYYIAQRMNSDPAWRSIKVILSDANVPGEGEHKIMDYIRRQRAQPNHDPNTHHVLCGADADLIMLGLATHEPYFTIIREEFKPNKPRPCDLCGQLGHEMKECKGIPKEKFGRHDELTSSSQFHVETQYIFVRLSILREYLYRDLEIHYSLPFAWDLERAIDDWVFMCFFVGNDFLPHLPSLEIRENAIDRLIKLYKDNVPKFKGYLTENGMPNMERVEIILTGIGRLEDEIFMKRHESDEQQRQRERNRSNNYQPPNKRQRPMTDPSGGVAMPVWMSAPQLEPQPIGQRPTSSISNPAQANIQLRQMQRVSFSSTEASSFQSRPGKRKYDEANADDVVVDRRQEEEQQEEDNNPNDSVRLWEEGWRERYYKNKFNVRPQDLEEFRVQVAQHYARGLCWVLQYYYQGVPSWNWYYPYHYAPFASDFLKLKDLSMDFDKTTKPFKPLEQLMAVFPSLSRQFLPVEWQRLMCDKDSSIIDFYPLNFSVDLNGKRYEWQGVALLPFVDEKRLHRTLESVYSTLTADEKKRNRRDYDRLYIHSSNLCFDYFKELYVNGGTEVTRKNPLDMPTMLSGGVAGQIWPDDTVIPIGEQVKGLLPNCKDIQNNQVICVKYRDLSFDEDYIFKAKLLQNITMPERTLRPRDHDQNTPYRPNLGFAQRPQFQRDFAPAQRFIRHSINNQPPGGFFPQHQQQQTQYNQYRSQSYASFDPYRQQQQHQNNYNGPRQEYRPRMSSYRPPQPPYNQYRSHNNDGGSWN